MQKNIRIGKIEVSENSQALVIPEIGINHNGDLKIAFEMVDSAKRAGARLIKHQTHVVDDEMSPEAKKVIPGNADISIYEIMKECALSEDEERELKRYTESLGMEFLSTPFSRAAADRLERMGVKACKIGSAEMNHYPLLDYIASFGKPLIVSTGMNKLEDVKKAVDILEKRQVPYALMHTTNLYPTPSHLIRLGAMQELMKEFPDALVGLSDHSVNNTACIAAMALGAKIVERHYTDRIDREGPDIACSMDEEGLRSLLQSADEIKQMMNGKKEAAIEEQITIDFAFATLVTIKNIKKGEYFTLDNLWAKRPGTGEIRAEHLVDVIGHRAVCDIPINTHLREEMISIEKETEVL